MVRYALTAALAAGVFAGAATNSRAQDKKGVATKESKLEKATPATAVDFVGTYKLSLQSIATLGSRIEAARSAADPVTLAILARELGVAEKVAGKKADLTADALAVEAVDLAKLRNQSDELAAVALAVDADAARTELQKHSTAAKKREEDAAAAAKSGERARGLQGDLIIVNLHGVPMRVYVNGQYRGTAGANSTDYFYVNDPHGPTTFEVRYPDGRFRARWVSVSHTIPSFRWRIDPSIP
jgi:hypothetical protein